MATQSRPVPNSPPKGTRKVDMNKEGDTGGGDHGHHIIPLDVYLKVFACLIGLTFITVLAARFDFGELNTIIAFAIASVKAALVLSIFMHLKYDNMMNRVIIGSSAFFLIVMYFFCFVDESTRIVIAP